MLILPARDLWEHVSTTQTLFYEVKIFHMIGEHQHLCYHDDQVNPQIRERNISAPAGFEPGTSGLHKIFSPESYPLGHRDPLHTKRMFLMLFYSGVSMKYTCIFDVL